MQVTVNDEPRELHDDATIHALLDVCGLGNAACAVEVNRELVPKRQHELHQLRAGDVVEIVTLVGGG